MEFKNKITILKEEADIVTLLINPGAGEVDSSVFADSFSEIKKKFPEKNFQFIPNSVKNYTRLESSFVTSYLAVGQ